MKGYFFLLLIRVEKQRSQNRFKVKIARLIMWTSSSMGDVKLTGLGYDVQPSYENNVKGLNAGHLNYSESLIVSSLNPLYQYFLPELLLC